MDKIMTIEENYKILKNIISDELKSMSIDEIKSKPLYLAKNCSIRYCEKTNSKFEKIMPIMQNLFVVYISSMLCFT